MMKIKLDKEGYLEQLAEQHAEELFRLVDSNRSYLREWLPWLDSSKSVDDTRDFIMRSTAQDQAGRGPQAGIWHRGRLVGVIGFVTVDAARKFELGFWIAQDAQRKGLITASCRALIEYAFHEMNLDKVEIRCATNNHRSRAVAERLGLKLEGIQENVQQLYGRDIDHAVYAITAAKWRGTSAPYQALLRTHASEERRPLTEVSVEQEITWRHLNEQ